MITGPKIRVLLLAALSTGDTALSCLAQHGGFDVTFVTHANEGASDYVPLLDRAEALGFTAFCYKDGDLKRHRPRKHRVEAVMWLGGDLLTFAMVSEFDIGLVLGWSELIKTDLLRAVRIGWIGHHESMLPKRRGRAPIVWPILHDCAESGVSFFWLTEGVDDGDIFCQAPFPIGPRDTSADLLAKANQVTRDLLLNDVLPNLAAGNFKRTPQDHSQATYCPRRTPQEGIIRWMDRAEDIERQVRALTNPYPGASTWFRLKRCMIWQSRVVSPREYHPDMVYKRAGTIVWISDDGTKQWVACGGILEIYLKPGTVKVGDRFDGQQYFEP